MSPYILYIDTVCLHMYCSLSHFPLFSLPTQKTNFQTYARVPPVDLLKLEPDVYRTIVAVVELVCVSCLLCPQSKVQLLGNYVLMVIMLGALWTHYMVKDTADKFGPAVFCLTLLLTRLYTCGKLEVKLKAS